MALAACCTPPGEPVPVIVARYVPEDVELNAHDGVAVPLGERMTGVGQFTTSPVIGLVAELRLTVPAKLFVLVRVTKTAAFVAPELKSSGLLTEMVKSPTWTIDCAE